MIWIISILLMVSFVLGGVFIKYAPPLHNIVQEDFIQRAYNNVKLEALQYADLLIRTNAVDLTAQDPAKRTVALPDKLITPLISDRGIPKLNLSVKIYFAKSPDTTITVTVNQK